MQRDNNHCSGMEMRCYGGMPFEDHCQTTPTHRDAEGGKWCGPCAEASGVEVVPLGDGTCPTLHRAGPVVDTTQRCTDCGAVLLDLVRHGFPEGGGVVLHRHPTDPPGDGPTRATRADVFGGTATPCTEVIRAA